MTLLFINILHINYIYIDSMGRNGNLCASRITISPQTISVMTLIIMYCHDSNLQQSLLQRDNNIVFIKSAPCHDVAYII